MMKKLLILILITSFSYSQGKSTLRRFWLKKNNNIKTMSVQGGKVVWNKRNLAGNKVASGIYIVLLSNDDASETAVTKIAIIN
jgi:hypothetical protein